MNWKKLIKKLDRKEYLLYSCILIAGVLVDLLTKRLAELFLQDRDIVTLIPGFLRLTYAENDGIAFGMLGGGGIGRVLFMTVSTVMILGVGGYLFLGHAQDRRYGIALSLIVSGGIGNMIERVFKGYVVDFISVILYYPDFKAGIRQYYFPIFNGADSLVCIGAGLLILFLIIDIVRESKAAKRTSGEEPPQDPEQK